MPSKLSNLFKKKYNIKDLYIAFLAIKNEKGMYISSTKTPDIIVVRKKAEKAYHYSSKPEYIEIFSNTLFNSDLYDSDLASGERYVYETVPLFKYVTLDVLNKGKMTKKELLKFYERKSNEYIGSCTVAKQNKPSCESVNDNLNNYGVYLTDQKYNIDPAIGREIEMERLFVALMTKEKGAIIVGEAGVGKTALVKGLAYRIINGNVPDLLKNKKILSINVSTLVSGSQFLGTFENKILTILRELTEDKNTILFLDEIHMAIGAGATHDDPTGTLANILKPFFDTDLNIIGATTENEYNKYVLSDSAFRRRFEKVIVKEPTYQVLFKILLENIAELEKIYKINFNFEINEIKEILNFIIEATDVKHQVYNDKLYNPDIALMLLTKAFVYATINNSDNCLKIANIAKAIRECSNLNESTRESLSRNLMLLFEHENHVNQEELGGKVYRLKI